ncbi:type 1 periplasmic binding fold superfamily protein [uncultured Psychroserpens sp.]|uniref:type 1 periplasmic binding fold superfamily protein n=1 Tax=uncultured Psychroserpens sp. TaxID=255436 RepID=UPI00261FE45E|nr:type 1 periplasmic binding fold superfamily protein [uncultured Psychroserpens sp.]
MKTTKFLLGAVLCFSLFLTSCSDDDDGGTPEQPNEEEVITDVTLTLTNITDTNDVVELKSVDPDGEDGPTAPTITITGNFTAGATYTGVMDLFNSIEMEDITEEVTVTEPDEHFFTYAISGLDISFSRSANDIVRMDGNKLGFETTWVVANNPGTGNITVQLWHESETVDDSNELGTQTGGEPDVDLTFTGVTIQ